MHVKTVHSNPAYEAMEKQVAEAIAASEQLFSTDAKGLWEAYLDWWGDDRQYYNCHCCRRFIETYGALCSIIDGRIVPLLPHPIAPIVAKAKVTGVFYSELAEWGQAVTGQWTHLHGTNPKSHKGIKTAFQVMSEKRQDYIMLKHAIRDYPKEAVVQAIRVLKADVDRPEKTLPIAEWFLEVHGMDANRLWAAVAAAPPGWCHIRSTMINTLLDDVIIGHDYETIRRRWNEKMHPLQYQRPTSIKEGNIDEANKLVEHLGATASLQRRFADLSDVRVFVWQPKPTAPVAPPPGRAFDSLKTQQRVKPVELPPQKMRWDEFLPLLREATELSILCPPHGGYYGLVTAVDPQAPLLFQWDNPVSWYFYHGGSPAQYWNITPGWNNVQAVFLKPCHWTDPTAHKHQGKGVFFSIPGARDMKYKNGGLWFPEDLKSEYHGIRKAMEALSKSSSISGVGTAHGLCLDTRSVTLRIGNDTYTVEV